MGSGSSSHVKNIQLEQKQSNNSAVKSEKESFAKQRSFKSSKVANKAEIAKPKTNVTDEQDVNEDSSRTVEEVEKQLTESESQRLDLEDRVQALEERLDYYRNQDVLKEEKTCDETLHAKDQYITKLEKEKSDLEVESNKVKQRSRKKIKQLTSQLSEYKQESNFQMMELREEITRLKEQNLTLQESSSDHKPLTSSETDGADGIPGGGKMKLILELSAQVTEQNDKISKLERKLKDRDQIIDELRVKLKNNMEYLKARDEVGNQRSATNDKNNNHNQKVSKSYSHNQNHSKRTAELSRKPADSATKSAESSRNNIDSLFAVTEENSEEEFDEEGKMKKLTALLHGVRSKNDKLRQSTDSLDDGKVNDNDDFLAIRDDGDELRKFSGTSRDSGYLGSAGKQRKIAAQDKVLPNYGQKEPSFSLESGLSDSDLDDLGNISGSHSQISSAPPTLQRNIVGQKLKKTSSLKRRVSQKKDRTDKPNIPKPSLAFVNSAQRPVTDDHDSIFQIPGSSSLSSVQVS